MSKDTTRTPGTLSHRADEWPAPKPVSQTVVGVPGGSVSWVEGKRKARSGHGVCSGDQMRGMGGGGSAAVAMRAIKCGAWEGGGSVPRLLTSASSSSSAATTCSGQMKMPRVDEDDISANCS